VAVENVEGVDDHGGERWEGEMVMGKCGCLGQGMGLRKRA